MSEENTSSHTESAFALRTAFKQSQSQLTQAHLFERLGYHLFESGWSDELMQWWLDELCLQYGAQHGQITLQHAGALKIVAQRGRTFPQGTRIPMMGALALWLKTPLKFEFHTQHIPSLWTITANEIVTTPYYFTHVPIAYHQQPVGLLALSTIKPIEKTQIGHLQSTCGLMGFVLHEKRESTQKTDSSALQKLTPREREVFALLPSGASNALLAEKLNISPGTVKIHIERILSKLALKDRTQAAVKAVEAGFSSTGL